jgi:hypothetical protein
MDLTWLLCMQTNLLVMVSYPQGRDYFSDGVCMIRGGGDVFEQIFGALHVHPPVLLKFVLQYDKCNNLHNGTFATSSRQ